MSIFLHALIVYIVDFAYSHRECLLNVVQDQSVPLRTAFFLSLSTTMYCNFVNVLVCISLYLQLPVSPLTVHFYTQVLLDCHCGLDSTVIRFMGGGCNRCLYSQQLPTAVFFKHVC